MAASVILKTFTGWTENVPTHGFDIRAHLDTSSGLPQPDWDAALSWANAHLDERERSDFSNAIAGDWLAAMQETLGPHYATIDSEHFRILGRPVVIELPRLARIAEGCMLRLLSLLPNIARFPAPGKQMILVLDAEWNYYTYVAHYHADGEFGVSAGMHIRCPYPHIVVVENAASVQATVAHELVHAALMDWGLPVWIEEGLAQIGEVDVAGNEMAFDVKRVRKQKEYWRANGLELFWSDEGFARPDDVQGYCYQLAEFLVRLLLEDSRPRWFGIDRRSETRFLDFLRHAKAVDAGQAGARDHLGSTLGQLAAKSLGPGSWEPQGRYDSNATNMPPRI